MKTALLRFFLTAILIPVQLSVLILVVGVMQTEKVLSGDSGAPMLAIAIFALIPLLAVIWTERVRFGWRLLAWFAGVIATTGTVALLNSMMVASADEFWISLNPLRFSLLFRLIVYLVGGSAASFLPAWALCRIGRR